MKYKYIISLIIFMLFNLSCAEDNNQAMNIDTYIDAYIIDVDGNDLLSKNQEKTIDLNDISLYYLIEDKEILYDKKNLDSPHGFVLLPPEGKFDRYILRIFPNSCCENSISYLKYNNYETDTLSLKINHTNSSIICTSVFLNGEKVWGANHDNDNSNRRLISIIK